MTDTWTQPDGPAAAPASSLLEQAKQGRARITQQLGQVQAARPATGAGPAAQAKWLRDKAAVHDQIGGYLRSIGDIPGAVEAEVLASRCRIDARDLTSPATTDRESTAGLDGPRRTPTRPVAAAPPANASTCQGLIATDAGRTRGADRGEPSRPGADRADDGLLVTCGPGLP